MQEDAKQRKKRAVTVDRVTVQVIKPVQSSATESFIILER